MKKGFTLIELLAIIIIMGTISILSFSSITDTIRKNKEKEIKVFEKNIFTAAELYITANLDSYKNLDEIDNIEKIKVKDLVESGYLNRTINNPTNIQLLDYYVIAKRTLEKGLEYTLSYQGNPSDGNLYYTESILNGAVPELDPGMIPITFVNNKPVKADLYTNWYDYETKKWANVVLVSEASRNNYKTAKAGKEILEADILAYFVWVPRYKFKLFNTAGAPNTTPISIEIIFENNKTQKSTGTTDGTYLTPPGFTFGLEELNGLWVGKFETTGSVAAPTIKPNLSPLSNQKQRFQFDTSKIFKSYSVSTDSRVMKNSEWGTVAYLSHSKYGVNEEIRTNNNFPIITGCGASTVNGDTNESCQIEYGNSLSYPQSTAGNITGIFDMSGGSYEYTMGVLADSNGTPYSGRNSDWNSGFNGPFGGVSTAPFELTTGVPFPEQKYFDLYTSSDAMTACNGKKCLGQGIIETNGWYQDAFRFTYPKMPFHIRSGRYNLRTSSGIFLVGTDDSGVSYGTVSFRVVISR
ncbi:MAG: hypothetical protein RSE21_01695 [Bacilli bacterium]